MQVEELDQERIPADRKVRANVGGGPWVQGDWGVQGFRVLVFRVRGFGCRSRALGFWFG